MTEEEKKSETKMLTTRAAARLVTPEVAYHSSPTILAAPQLKCREMLLATQLIKMRLTLQMMPQVSLQMLQMKPLQKRPPQLRPP